MIKYTYLLTRVSSRKRQFNTIAISIKVQLNKQGSKKGNLSKKEPGVKQEKQSFRCQSISCSFDSMNNNVLNTSTLRETFFLCQYHFKKKYFLLYCEQEVSKTKEHDGERTNLLGKCWGIFLQVEPRNLRMKDFICKCKQEVLVFLSGNYRNTNNSITKKCSCLHEPSLRQLAVIDCMACV